MESDRVMIPLRLLTQIFVLFAGGTLANGLVNLLHAQGPNPPVGPVLKSTAHARMRVNPSIGRLVEFGRFGGDNVIYVTPTAITQDVFNNAQPERTTCAFEIWGGDKIWNTKQSDWSALPPCDPPLVVDGFGWALTDQGDRHIEIQSPVLPTLNIQITRRFELFEDTPDLVISNSITRTAAPTGAVDKVHIWSVSQIDTPEYSLSQIASDKPAGSSDWINLGGPNPNLADFIDIHPGGDSLTFDPPETNNMKIGTYGRWLAAVYADDVLVQSTQYDPDDSYADGVPPNADGVPLEIFITNDYIELETLSAWPNLGVGETLSNVVYWQLLERPSGADPADVATFV